MAAIKKVTEVLILGEKEELPRLLKPETTPGYKYSIVQDDLALRQLIGREGYRFKAVILNLRLYQGDSGLGEPSTFETTDELIRWVVESCPWAVVRVMNKKRPGIPTVKKKSKEVFVISKYIIGQEINIEQWILTKLAKLLDSFSTDPLPPAPYAAGEMSFLYEAGPLLFSLCKTEEPWALEADGIVVPIFGSLDIGEVGEAWMRFKKPSPSLSELMDKTKLHNPVTPKTPALAVTNYSLNDKKVSRSVIFATYSDDSPTPLVRHAVEGCLAAIQLACQQPVIMREVLRDLDALIRRPNGLPAPLNETLSGQIEKQQSVENHRAVERLKEVLDTEQQLLSPQVTLQSLGLNNLRLVRSFSFVGETADEFDAPEMESATSKDIKQKVTSFETH